MKYGPLGRSGLIVSRICLGGNSWGAKGRRGWGKFDEDEAPAYFRRALDVGITFFDTADAYNAGRSEEIMGATLMKMVKREDVVISTKVGIRMSPSQNDQGTGRKHLMAAIDVQLKRLQTDYIDVYQVHRLDPYTPMEETMYTLDQIVRSGKVRYIGGSTMPAYKFAQMCMIADWKGYAKPVAMQNLYNLIAREEEKEMNPLCLEQGVGLIPYSPLARGFLAANRAKDGGGVTERAVQRIVTDWPSRAMPMISVRWLPQRGHMGSRPGISRLMSARSSLRPRFRALRESLRTSKLTAFQPSTSSLRRRPFTTVGRR